MSGIQAKVAELTATGDSQTSFEDANMQSSPFMSSSIPPGFDAEEQTSVKVVALVREHDLEGNSLSIVSRLRNDLCCIAKSILRLLTSDQGKI